MYDDGHYLRAGVSRPRIISGYGIMECQSRIRVILANHSGDDSLYTVETEILTVNHST